MPLQPGQILNNRYRIDRLLGQGGFGAVYQAWDKNLDEAVAIKESLDDSPAAEKQFRSEAKLLFNLHHPNLPRVHDCFAIPNQGLYLSMDYIQGHSLEQMLGQRGGPLPLPQVLDWIGQICDALDYLHRQSPPVIHRDIKPANIIICANGRDNGRPFLVDFGISKVFDPVRKTTVAARAYTPGYSPPEQYGSASTDGRSDIYALGATLYHLLTGEAPPQSIDITAGVARPPAPPPARNPAVPAALGQAVMRALQLNRDQRWSSAAEFKQALLSAAPAPARVAPAPAPSPVLVVPTQVVRSAPSLAQPTPGGPTIPVAPSKVQRNWPLWGLAGTGLLALVAAVAMLLGWLAGGGGQATEAPPLRTSTAIAALPTGAASSTPAAATDTPTAMTAPAAAPSRTPNRPAPTQLPAEITDARGIPMALIPAGEFMMGADEAKIRARWPDDSQENFTNFGPPHAVYLDAFYMDVHLVSAERFAEFLSDPANQGQDTSRWLIDSQSDVFTYANGAWTYDPAKSDYPSGAAWYGAQAYCAWRGGRLPSEAEWEKAARGGLAGKLYPWGDDEAVCEAGAVNGAWSWNCGIGDAPISQYAPNGYGLFDMAGNSWQWVQDWYEPEYYSRSPSNNPPGPASGDDKVMRGGSWNGPDFIRYVFFRLPSDPAKISGADTGFRCVQSADK